MGAGLQGQLRRVRAQQEHPADGARRAAAYAGVRRKHKVMSMSEEKNPPNNFVRFMIVCLSVFIAWMIGFNFISVDPIGEIGQGLIALLVLLVFIVLSESFDNFSVDKLISITRDRNKQKEKANELKRENVELRNQIINIATTLNQNQSSTNIIGMPDNIISKFYVQKASQEEVEEKEKEDETREEEKPRAVRKRINRKVYENLVFNKFIEKNDLGLASLIRDAKLVTQFHGIDAITNMQPVYDGYINNDGKEIFILVRPSLTASIMWQERMYLLLNKIYLYNKVKNANAHLVVLLAELNEFNEASFRGREPEKFKEYFEPALTSGLLRISEVKLSASEQEESYTSR